MFFSLNPINVTQVEKQWFVGGGGWVKPVTISEIMNFFPTDVIPYQDSGDDQGFVVKTLNDLKGLKQECYNILFLLYYQTAFV